MLTLEQRLLSANEKFKAKDYNNAIIDYQTIINTIMLLLPDIHTARAFPEKSLILIQAMIQLSKCLYILKQYASAKEWLAKATNFSNVHLADFYKNDKAYLLVDLLTTKARVYYVLNDLPAAIAHFSEALETFIYQPHADKKIDQFADLVIRRAKALNQIGSDCQALSDYDFALSLSISKQEKADTHYQMASLYQKLGYVEFAQLALNKACQAQPEHQQRYNDEFKKITFNSSIKQKFTSIESADLNFAAKNICKHRVTDEKTFKKAQTYFKLSNYQDALHQAFLTLGKTNELSKILDFIGNCYYKKANFELAVIYFSEAIKLFPSNELLYQQRKKAYLHLYKKHKQNSFQEKAAADGNAYRKIFNIKALTTKTTDTTTAPQPQKQPIASIEDHPELQKLIKQASIKKIPEILSACNGLFQASEFTIAKQFMEKIIEKLPSNQIYSMLAVAYQNLSEYDKAEACINLLRERNYKFKPEEYQMILISHQYFKRYDELKNTCLFLIKNYKNSADMHVLSEIYDDLSRAEFNLKNYDKAIEYSSAAIAIHIEIQERKLCTDCLSKSYSLRGDSLLEQQAYWQAAIDLNRARSIQIKTDKANVFLIKLAKIFTISKQPLLNNIIINESSLKEAALKQETSDKPDMAESAAFKCYKASSAPSLNPDPSHTMYNLRLRLFDNPRSTAKLFYALGNFTQSLEEFYNQLGTFADKTHLNGKEKLLLAKTLLSIGHCYYSLKNHLMAVYFYTEALKLNPSSAKALEFRSEAWNKLAKNITDPKLKLALLQEAEADKNKLKDETNDSNLTTSTLAKK